jgi:hypothetical protein
VESAEVRPGQYQKESELMGGTSCWKGEGGGIVRMWKESELVRVTHLLKGVEKGTGPDVKRRQEALICQGGQRAGEGRERGWAGLTVHVAVL